jgi:hypothetical protein
MVRVRTGHRPTDWDDRGPASGLGNATVLAGSTLVGDPTASPRRVDAFVAPPITARQAGRYVARVPDAAVLVLIASHANGEKTRRYAGAVIEWGSIREAAMVLGVRPQTIRGLLQEAQRRLTA